VLTNVRHLDGFKALLETKILPQAISAPRLKGDPFISMKAGRAAFWNFARADYLAAYVNNSRTRLDTENLTMWRAAGLAVTDEGTLTYGDTLDTNGSVVPYLPNAREDQFACALIWIVLRTMNFVAPHTDTAAATNSTSGLPDTPAMPVNQKGPEAATIHTRIAHWKRLRGQLEDWYDSLPFTFQPYATMSTAPRNEDQADESKTRFYRLFFSVPMCAAALQLYHFAQILLLLNQPMDETDTRNLAKRIQIFRNISEESEHHSRQICGIALGKPPPAVSRQMVHSLYLAGLCFEQDEDRKVVMELLANVEKETGSSTAQRMKDLRQQWNWNEDITELNE
jgi:hypothetical protein